jgi:putative transposase
MSLETIRRRNLPHWDVPTAAYFVTVCLDGSIPARGLLDLANYRTELSRRPRPQDQTEDEWKLTQWKHSFARMDQWLDCAEGCRHLEIPELSQIVIDAFYHFAGERYDLLGFVVMPSHCHWVFQPLESWTSTLEPTDPPRSPRQRIVHSIDRHTAAQCNRLLNRTGPFWQREPYDHWIRSPEELKRILLYIDGNPLKAGYVTSPEAWPYSSAHDRNRFNVELGQPLLRPKSLIAR